MKPQRIQLSRKAGFDLQKVSKELNGLRAINCARPARFGNPVKVGPGETNHFAVSFFRDIVREGKTFPFTKENIRKELWGYNLACWCKPEEECHCDVLLEVANG